jgi:hypothetical protein
MRFVIRMLGYALIALAIVVGVLDGARSLANGAFSLRPLGESLYGLLAERYLLIQPAIERHVSEGLWNNVVLPLTLQPTAIVCLILGVVLAFLARKKSAPVNVQAR